MQLVVISQLYNSKTKLNIKKFKARMTLEERANFGASSTIHMVNGVVQRVGWGVTPQKMFRSYISVG